MKSTNTKVRLEIPSIEALYRGNLTDYYKILLTSSIACDIVYEEDPVKALEQLYHPFAHNIKQMIVSGCSDDKKHQIPLDVKYLICKDDDARRIYVAFRGTHSMRDVIDDASFMIDDTRGQFHSGFYKRAYSIPIEYFKRRAQEKYQIIFTGHSLGGAVAAIVTARLLAEESLSPETLDRFLCVTFASPLIANDEFGSFINKNHQDKFHFFVLEDDPVPVLLSILSDLIHDENMLKRNDFKLGWTKLLGSVVSDSLSSFFTGVFSALSPFMNNLQLSIPKYTGFGHYIHIHDTVSGNKELTAIIDNKGNEVKVRIFTEKALTEIYAYGREKFTVSADALAVLQKHRMIRYIAELHSLFSIYYTDYRIRLGFFERHKILEFLWKKKTNECKYIASSELRIPENLEEISSLRIVVNEKGCLVFLSFLCSSSPYILAVKMKVGYLTYDGAVDSIQESGHVRFVFHCPNTLLLKSLSYISKKIHFEIIGHFNSVKIQLTLPNNPEEGLSSRTLKIASLPVESLYFYGVCFVTLLNGISEASNKPANLETYRTELLQSFDIIDKEISKVITEKLEAKGEELMNSLKEMSLKENCKYIPQAMVESVSLHRVVVDLLPTIHQIKERLSERYIPQEKGLKNFFVITAAVLAGVVGILYIPFGALGVLTSLFAVGVAATGVFKSVQKSSLRRQQKLNYLSNVTRYMDSMDVTRDGYLPYLWYYELALSEKCTDIGLWDKSESEVLSNWDNYFLRGHLRNIRPEERLKALKTLRVICENSKIRSILLEEVNILGYDLNILIDMITSVMSSL